MATVFALLGLFSARASVVLAANDIPDSVLTLQQQDTNFSSELLFMSVNVTSGESKLVDHMTLRLGTAVGCKWEKIVGSPGQGTTVFPTNRSWFMLAQQKCDDKVNQTILLGVRYFAAGREVAPSDLPIYHVFPSDYASPLSGWNVVWDHSCNVVVVAPKLNADRVVYETWMISEYDTQARQQHDLTTEPRVPRGWTKTNGLGAMDYFLKPTGGPYQLNCGTNCSFFTLEQWGVRGGGSSRIVGRNFHTGQVLSNVSNHFGIRTMTPLFDYKSFALLGLGVCPKVASGVCKDAAGALAMVSFDIFDHHFRVLAVANGGRPPESPEDSFSLGIAVSPPSDRSASVFVLVDDKVEMYSLETEGDITATLVRSSPYPGARPRAWLGLASYW